MGIRQDLEQAKQRFRKESSREMVDRYLQGEKQVDIARQMGVSENTVNRTICRFRERANDIWPGEAP